MCFIWCILCLLIGAVGVWYFMVRPLKLKLEVKPPVEPKPTPGPGPKPPVVRSSKSK